MQLACPACAATYRVPDNAIGSGRTMRCVRCGHEWFAVKPPEAVPEIVAAAPAPAPPPAPSPPPGKPPAPVRAPPREAAPAAAPKRDVRAPAVLVLAWVASLGLVGTGGYMFWTAREALTEIWPPLARIYLLLGA